MPRAAHFLSASILEVCPTLHLESAVALRSRFGFNPAAHEILATHDSELVGAVVQAIAADGGPVPPGGDVFVASQPPPEHGRTRLGYAGTPGRKILPEAASGVTVAWRLDRLIQPPHPQQSLEGNAEAAHQ